MNSVKVSKYKSKLFNPPIRMSQEPGPSHVNLAARESEPMSEDEMQEASLCCVCKL